MKAMPAAKFRSGEDRNLIINQKSERIGATAATRMSGEKANKKSFRSNIESHQPERNSFKRTESRPKFNQNFLKVRLRVGACVDATRRSADNLYCVGVGDGRKRASYLRHQPARSSRMREVGRVGRRSIRGQRRRRLGRDFYDGDYSRDAIRQFFSSESLLRAYPSRSGTL
jgi:hypothetical protein